MIYSQYEWERCWNESIFSLVPSHHLSQCWLINNWTPGNKFWWNFILETKFPYFQSRKLVRNYGLQSRGHFAQASVSTLTYGNMNIFWTCFQLTKMIYKHISIPFIQHLDGLVQDCSISNALALEILQSCTNSSNCWVVYSTDALWCLKIFVGTKTSFECFWAIVILVDAWSPFTDRF